VLALARERGLAVLALTFDYGQRHRREVASARRVAAHYGAAEHLVFALDLRAIGGSSLTADLAVPRDRSDREIGTGIPVTYVPFRNSILLSIAVAWAEARGAGLVLFGANHLDSSGYPDCRPAYIDSFNELVRRGSRAGAEGRPIRVEAPLLDLDKAAIVREGVRLRVPFELTWSCYQGGERACGRCDACLLRLRGFRAAGVPDPLPYERAADA
jgi:7-cyano-7-deazaguanine synthase